MRPKLNNLGCKTRQRFSRIQKWLSLKPGTGNRVTERGTWKTGTEKPWIFKIGTEITRIFKSRNGKSKYLKKQERKKLESFIIRTLMRSWITSEWFHHEKVLLLGIYLIQHPNSWLPRSTMTLGSQTSSLNTGWISAQKCRTSVLIKNIETRQRYEDCALFGKGLYRVQSGFKHFTIGGETSFENAGMNDKCIVLSILTELTLWWKNMRYHRVSVQERVE